VKSLHNLPRRQLRRLGLAPARVPPTDAWRTLLDEVSRAYGDADQERYLLERSQDISSREMEELYDALQHERDRLESRVSERTAALAASEARFRSRPSFPRGGNPESFPFSGKSLGPRLRGDDGTTLDSRPHHPFAGARRHQLR